MPSPFCSLLYSGLHGYCGSDSLCNTGNTQEVIVYHFFECVRYNRRAPIDSISVSSSDLKDNPLGWGGVGGGLTVYFGDPIDPVPEPVNHDFMP